MWFSGNMFVPDYTLDMFTRINLDALSKVKQVENYKANSLLLNFIRIHCIGRFGSF